MRPVAVILMILGVATFCAEGTTLNGVTIENELGGPGVPNVEIAAVSGANPTATDSLGRFALEFPKLRPGDHVRLLVKKDGYQVVNDIQLELYLPSDTDNRPLTILVCKQGRREEMAGRFYRTNFNKAIEQAYQMKLKLLREERASVLRIARLEQERDDARSAAAQAADELARQNGPSAELYHRAIQLFLRGDVDEALKVLNDFDLKALVQASRRKREESAQLSDAVVRAYLLKGHLLSTRLDFKGAELAYEEAATEAPDSFDAQFALASFNEYAFLQEKMDRPATLTRFAVATVAYEKCLKLARTKSQRERVLAQLGAVYRRQSRIKESRAAYEESGDDWPRVGSRRSG